MPYVCEIGTRGAFRELRCESNSSDYRARYYNSQFGRFLAEDPLRFGIGTRFGDMSTNSYAYVANDPMKRKDPFGLWQVTIGGGLGLGALLTFGDNSGQWNFGLYSGVGEGAFLDFDPTDSGGCHKFGATGSLKWRGEVGTGLAARVDATLEDGSDPSVEVAVSAEPVGGVSWSPMKPDEPPHGFLGLGAGLFGGVGVTYHSPPKCGCPQ